MDFLRLRDKTAIITNPKSYLTKSIAQQLAELGTNIALVGETDRECERFMEQLNNQREVNERFGRATLIHTDFKDEKSISETVGRTVEAFGGVDILIETSAVNLAILRESENTGGSLAEKVKISLKTPTLLIEKMIPFFKSRKKGRIIFLVSDLPRMGVKKEDLLLGTREALEDYAKGLAKELADVGVSINCLGVGPTEEYLLTRYPKAASLQAAEDELTKTLPNFKKIDHRDEANAICLFASQLSTVITGQSIAISGSP